MKIAFICGSLEAGRDGVGDYTVRLGRCLAERGCKVLLVGYFDRFLDNQILRRSDEFGIASVRFSHEVPVEEKLDALRGILNEFEPAWISLQYVSYGFHDKGLPFLLGRELESLRTSCKWHFMFHELWVGVSRSTTIKMWILRFLQQRIVKRLVHRLEPCVVHTQMDYYTKTLKSAIGVVANRLPLFGNIPYVENEGRLPSDYDRIPEEAVILLHFGAVGSEMESLLSHLIKTQDLARESGKSLCLVHIGGGGRHLEAFLDAGRQVLDDGNVIELGRLSAEEISLWLQVADLGHSRNTPLFWQKSGAIQSMREHGLPVLLNTGRNDEETDFYGNEVEGLIQELGDELPSKAMGFRQLPLVVDQFISVLEEAEE